MAAFHKVRAEMADKEAQRQVMQGLRGGEAHGLVLAWRVWGKGSILKRVQLAESPTVRHLVTSATKSEGFQ